MTLCQFCGIRVDLGRPSYMLHSGPACPRCVERRDLYPDIEPLHCNPPARRHLHLVGRPPVDPRECDELAMSIVCIERVPMSLIGADRVEAIRRLRGRGVDAIEMARLCKSRLKTINNILRRLPTLEAAR